MHLKEFLARSGYTQKEWADAWGLYPQQVYNWGKFCHPSLALVKEIEESTKGYVDVKSMIYAKEEDTYDPILRAIAKEIIEGRCDVVKKSKERREGRKRKRKNRDDDSEANEGDRESS